MMVAQETKHVGVFNVLIEHSCVNKYMTGHLLVNH